MKHRLLLWTLPVILLAQGIVINDPTKNWTAIVPEPPIPRVAAGQSFISFYGHKVTRITDQRSSRDGGAWEHFYSDRSPLSRNSSYLNISGPGGGTWIQPLTAGIPTVFPYSVYDEKAAPQYVGQSVWSSSDDEILYFIGDYVQLWSFNARTRRKKMIRDFTKELSKGMIKEGYLRMQFASRDGKRLIMDYVRQNKEAFGAILYDVPTNTARVFHGDHVADRNPNPINPSFRLAGVGAEKSGEILFMQENGKSLNNVSSNPQEAADTYTYIGKWEDGPLAKGTSVGGIYSIGHGAVLWKEHVRVTFESGYYINNVDWLFSLRRADLTKPPDAQNKGRFPYRDIFFWPFSTGTGVHLSASSFSDDWIAVSTYQESSCGQRLMSPLSNEILMVSSTGQTEYDEKNHKLVKNGEIHRLTHHFSYPEDCNKPVPYWGQPRAAISMDGKYVVFTSTFGRTGRNDVFVLHLPKHLIPGQ